MPPSPTPACPRGRRAERSHATRSATPAPHLRGLLVVLPLRLQQRLDQRLLHSLLGHLLWLGVKRGGQSHKSSSPRVTHAPSLPLLDPGDLAETSHAPVMLGAPAGGTRGVGSRQAGVVRGRAWGAGRAPCAHSIAPSQEVTGKGAVGAAPGCVWHCSAPSLIPGWVTCAGTMRPPQALVGLWEHPASPAGQGGAGNPSPALTRSEEGGRSPPPAQRRCLLWPHFFS